MTAMRVDHRLVEDPEDAALVHNMNELDRLKDLMRVTLPSICFKRENTEFGGGKKWSATRSGQCGSSRETPC